jgi:predicted Zn-dependent protease
MTVKEIPISDEELRVLLETGYILREAAKFDDAEAVFRGMMEFLPNSEVPQVGLGTVFLQKGDFQTAEEICRAAVETNPASLYARVNYAEAILFGKKRDEAEEILNSIVSENSDSPHSHTAQALLDAADKISPR